MANDETKTALDATSLSADRWSGSQGNAHPTHRSLAAGDTFARDAGVLVEITDCPKPKDVPPPLPAMLGCIVDHVAALT